MTDVDGQRKKVYFFAMVLSRSRFKFVFFSEHPFISETAIAEHEEAFMFFDGYPHELVYDQDKVLLVNENKGDLILTRLSGLIVKADHLRCVSVAKVILRAKGN